jgi:hypothetical protein
VNINAKRASKMAVGGVINIILCLDTFTQSNG